MHIFFDSQGNFQWSVVMAGISVASLIIQGIIAHYSSEKNLKVQKNIANENITANVVSKARIDWIQKVREESAIFITKCLILFEYNYKQKALDLMNSTYKDWSPSAKDKEFFDAVNSVDNIKEEIEKNRVEINQSANRLILYFGPDESGKNDAIVKKINECISLINTNKSLSGNLVAKVTDIRDILRKYLKTEWKRATIEFNKDEIDN